MFFHNLLKGGQLLGLSTGFSTERVGTQKGSTSEGKNLLIKEQIPSFKI